MTSWSGVEHGFGHELWHQQYPDSIANFPLKGKSDFSSMREVRSYAPKQTMLWPRCPHSEFCVMQVYEGWNNSGLRFWHYPYAWVRNVHEIGSSPFFGLLTISCLLLYSTQTENCSFSQCVDPPAIHPYQEYIDYLEDVIIYNLQQELLEASNSFSRSIV
jgi:hypothetical protein